jgi:erythromycin esterase-like protein
MNKSALKGVRQLALTLLGCCLLGVIYADTKLQPLAINAPYRSADYVFLDQAVGAARVVAVGESIHITKEMPRARLAFVRYLHRQKGFNVLALEGSLLDAWTAQEHVYQARVQLLMDDAAAAAQFKREALFGLWQTAPMQAVLAYALTTQSSAQPLYLASFDSQPGMARAYGGDVAASLRAHFAALSQLDPRLNAQQTERWVAQLAPQLRCDQVPMIASKTASALAEIRTWLREVLPSLAGRRPALHLRVLQLVPVMMEKRIAFCGKWLAAHKSMRIYQAERDQVNAELVLALVALTVDAMPDSAQDNAQDNAPVGAQDSTPKKAEIKLLLWAHHSHLHYNTLGKTIASMGQHLHAVLGPELYTIGSFALHGSTPDLAKADQAQGLSQIFALAPIALASMPDRLYEQDLATLSPNDFFLNLRGNPDPRWQQQKRTRLEQSGAMPTVLSADFDAAIFLHTVQPAALDFLPKPMNLLISGVAWVQQNTRAALALGSAVIAFAIWRLRRRSARCKVRRKVQKNSLH